MTLSDTIAVLLKVMIIEAGMGGAGLAQDGAAHPIRQATGGLGRSRLA